MTKKELKIVKAKVNEVWQELLNYEILLLENNEPLENSEHRMRLIYAQTTMADVVSALGLPILELIDEKTENLIDEVYILKRNRETV